MDVSSRAGGGGVRSEWGGRGTWLFFICSGVAGGEEDGEDGARVGDDVLEGGDIEVGSKSRSGIEGDSKGLRVIRSIKKRRKALGKRSIERPSQ